MTEKSDEKAQGGNLNNPISNSANAGGGGGGVLKFRFDWRIRLEAHSRAQLNSLD